MLFDIVFSSMIQKFEVEENRNKKLSHMEDPLGVLASSSHGLARVVLLSSAPHPQNQSLADRLAAADLTKQAAQSVAPVVECSGKVEAVDEQGNLVLLMPNGALRIVRGDRIKSIQV